MSPLKSKCKVAMGINQDSISIINKAEEIGADGHCVIGSVSYYNAKQHEVIRILEDKGIIGSGPTSQEFADEIATDGWSPDAVSAIYLLDKLLKK